MWKQRSLSLEAAGAAVLCAVLTQRLSSQPSELPAELVCWLILPALFRATERCELGRGKSQTVLLGNLHADRRTSHWSKWIFAAGVAASSCFKVQGGIVKLCPVLTPLLLAYQEALAPNSEAFCISSGRDPSPAIGASWVASLIAVFSTMNFLYWDLREAVPAIAPTVALLVVFAALLGGPRRRSLVPQVSLQEAIVPVSARTATLLAIALGVRTIAFGQLGVDLASVVILGVVKALSWYTVAKTARSSSWCIATTIGTFAIASTRSPFTQSSEAQALAHIATCVLALGQTIQLLPRQLRGRSALWALALISLVPYAMNVLAIRDAQSSVVSRGHPVESLIANARDEFEHLVQRQSKSYAAAHKEYLRRYGVEPPPGFRAWYEFAESIESPIIDDFDMIHERISPFWDLSGNEVRKAMDEAKHAKGNELWACSTANASCSHGYRTRDRDFPLLFDTLLKDVRNALPANVEYLVNHFDEPAVLLPPSKDGKHRGKPKVRDLGKLPLWPKVTKYCVPRASDKNTTAQGTFGLPFLTDVASSKDLCRHTKYYRIHGLLDRPDSAQLIESTVPILSTSSFSTMGDLIFPSPAYIQDGFKYDPAYDVEWEEKRNNLYWAGSTTGGYAADGQWRFYQRQRFVELAQNLAARPYSYLREVGGAITRVTSPFLNSRLFDVAFTRVNQCERQCCRAQEDYFRTASWAHKDEALRSRLVFDIDGNGISGRYYKLLASRSVPLKMTILREWHDERLVPWAHYIPISTGMEELPELVLYLTSTERGQEAAREIAEAGRRWYFEGLRKADMAVYVYRLILELARLRDPEREAGHPRPAAGPV